MAIAEQKSKRDDGNRRGGDLFIVDNSDGDWKVRDYLREWTDISHTLDIATGSLEIGAILALDRFCPSAELGHRRAERPKIIHHRLINQDIAVGEEEDALFASRLPQSPDDLKCSIGLPGARGHHEQNTILSLGDGFDCSIDSVGLVVAGAFAAAVLEIVLQDDLLLVWTKSLPCPIFCPELPG